MEKVQNVIALDGPSGSGKSTITKQIAKDLGICYVDTGAMFRALAYELNQEQIDADDNAVQIALSDIKLEYQDDPKYLVHINGVNFSELIREHHVSELASRYSKLPSVRKYLLNFQRKLAEEQTCILEGRDIGTVVFPNAFAKFFLTASAEVRAKRRHLQLQKLGQNVAYEIILQGVIARDEADSGRLLAPLKQAEDADFVDTSAMLEQEVIEMLISRVRLKAKDNNIVL